MPSRSSKQEAINPKAKVCRTCDFGTLPVPRKLLTVSHEILPVVPAIAVLAANLSWQRSQPLWRHAHGFLAPCEKRCSTFLAETRGVTRSSQKSVPHQST